MTELTCKLCGKMFRARRADAKYCSAGCRYEAFFTILHPGRSRSGSRHKKPAVPEQPELRRSGRISRTAYYDTPMWAGYDEKAT